MRTHKGPTQSAWMSIKCKPIKTAVGIGIYEMYTYKDPNPVSSLDESLLICKSTKTLSLWK